MLKHILQEGMSVSLRNGSICEIHKARNGLYIINPKSGTLIRIPEDYNDKLVCDAFYPFTIDVIYRRISTIELKENTVGYQLSLDPRKKLIWERNETKVACDAGVVDVLKQIDHMKTCLIETVFRNVQFDSVAISSILGNATSVLYETSHKAEVSNG